MLAGMTSWELTAWQAFLSWRQAEQERQRREAGGLGDDGETTHW